MTAKRIVHEIPAQLEVKAYPYDTLQPDHRDRNWSDGRLNMRLDPNDPLVRTARLDRIIIPDAKIAEVLSESGYGGVTWMKTLRGGIRVSGNLFLVDESSVSLIVKISLGASHEGTVAAECAGKVTKIQDNLIEVTPADGDPVTHRIKHGRFFIRPLVKIDEKVKKGAMLAAPLTEGTARIDTSVEQLFNAHDVLKNCLPMAGRTYQVMRNALYKGVAGEASMVERSLDSRLWQLSVLPRVQDATLREKLIELIAVNDAFFSAVLDNPDRAKALEMVETHVAGNVTLNEEMAEAVEAARARLAEERERKERAIVTIEDVLAEKERQQEEREAKRAKRNKRKGAAALKPIEVDEETTADGSSEVETGTAETDDVEAGTEETGEADRATEDVSPRLTPSQQRLNAEFEARKAADEAGEAPAAVAETPKVEEPKPAKKPEAPKLDFKAKLKALGAQSPAGTPAAADAAPATDKTE